MSNLLLGVLCFGQKAEVQHRAHNDDNNDGQNAVMAGLGVDSIDLLRRCGLSGQPLGPQHSICHHTADNADQSRAHDGAELAKDIEEAEELV